MAPRLRHIRILLPLGLLLAACGPLPRPFQSDGDRHVVQPGAIFGLAVTLPEGTPSRARAGLADSLVDALNRQDIPATTNPDAPRTAKLSGTITQNRRDIWNSDLLIDWKIQDAKGQTLRRERQVARVDTALWGAGAPQTLADIARNAAPIVARMMRAEPAPPSEPAAEAAPAPQTAFRIVSEEPPPAPAKPMQLKIPGPTELANAEPAPAPAPAPSKTARPVNAPPVNAPPVNAPPVNAPPAEPSPAIATLTEPPPQRPAAKPAPTLTETAPAPAGAGPASPAPAAAEPRPTFVFKGKPSVAVIPVVGAPGDGNRALTAAIRAALILGGIKVAPDVASGDIKIDGKVTVQRVNASAEKIDILWTIRSPDGQELGTVGQGNQIQAGSLDGPWGPLPQLIAKEAAKGVQQVIDKLSKNPG